MKQKISLLAVCAVLLSLFGAGCLAVVLDPGRKAEEQLAAARKEDVFVLSPADARSVLEQFAPELRFVERQTGVSIDELTGETLALIQTQAAREQYNGSYRFGELMDTLAVFCAGHRGGGAPSARCRAHRHHHGAGVLRPPAGRSLRPKIYRRTGGPDSDGDGLPPGGERACRGGLGDRLRQDCVLHPVRPRAR